MPATINIHQAKTQLSSLVAQAEPGEEIVPGETFAKGLVTIGPDFDVLPDDLMEHFR